MARQIISQSRLSTASDILHASKWLTTTAGLIGLFTATASSAFAQSISIDRSVDGFTNTSLNNGVSCSGTCSITGGLINNDGNNLFHSFSEFNVDIGATVTFEDPGVTSIFSRVTGNSFTSIDGTLSVDGSADLYLLNPNGILFGEGAKLDIRGSFLSTTANSILFDDNEAFSSTNRDTTALLSVSVPTGLQFGANPEPIAVVGSGHALTYDAEGSFSVTRRDPSTGLFAHPEQSLALIGGDVLLEGGNIIAENGTVEIGSVASDSQVYFKVEDSSWNFDYSDVANFGDVSLTQRSSIDVSGSDAGSVHINSRNIAIEESSAIFAKVESSGNGEIILNASEAINVIGEDLSGAQPMVTGASIEIANGATGDGNSAIILSANTINVSEAGQIGIAMAGNGASGTVSATAETIHVDGGNASSPSSLYAAVIRGYRLGSGAFGQGGDLVINADQLNVTNGAQISTSTFDAGNAGNLTVNASDIRVIGRNPFNIEAVSSIRSVSETVPLNFLLISNDPPTFVFPSVAEGSGDGGVVRLNTERLLVSDVGQIAVGTLSNNSGGSLIINASESIELTGGDSSARSGLFASALGDTRVPVPSKGAAGSIEINTPQLNVLNGATVNVSTLPSEAQTTSSRKPSEGIGGDINITAGNINIKEGGFITANTAAGDRANITIQSDSLVLREGGQITTNATGSATGGNITIDAEALIAFENSDITANATDSFGGRIVVNAPTIIGTAYRDALTSESDITATSALGPAFSGSVELNSPEIDPTEGTVELPEGLNAEDQIVAACEKLDTNVFISTGRGGLPEGAGQIATGRSLWNDFRLLEAEGHSMTAGDSSKAAVESAGARAIASPPIVEAQGWTVTSTGEITLGTRTALVAHTPQAQQCMGS